MNMVDSMAERNASKGGFTLIEVLLVVAILGILAGVVVVSFKGRGEEARIKATRVSIKAVCTAIEMYEVDTGRYPPSLNALIQSSGEANWNGPYIKGGLPTDSWGTPLGYKLQDKAFQVISGGPDGQVGSADDLTSE